LADTSPDEQRLAVFIDYENLAIGVRDTRYRKFNVQLVLERLLDKGKLLVKRAYADWSRYSDAKRSFHEAAIELIEVPQKSLGGKNSADIRLVVDAMDMSFSKEHINCFVIASGDSDFSPLVSKLKENNKYVIGIGVKNSTSDLLLDNCDEFIFYEDLVRGKERPLPELGDMPAKTRECFSLMVEAVQALQRENKEILWGSMVKETMKRKRPSFNEGYYGFRSFSHALEEARRRGIVTLRRDAKSGSYIVEDLGGTSDKSVQPAETAPEAGDAANGPTRPRRRRRGRRSGSRGAGSADAAASGADDNGGDEEGDDASAEAGEERTAAESGESAEAPPASPPPAAEQPSFSLFSWMRRDDSAPSPPAKEKEKPSDPDPKD